MYPPMSTQLETLGIDVVEGFEADQLNQFPADVYVIGNVAKRSLPVVEEILNRGLAYISGPQWLAEKCIAPPLGISSSGHTRQNHCRQHVGLGIRICWFSTRLFDWWRATKLFGIGTFAASNTPRPCEPITIFCD
jgi:hypothetical protein